MDRIPLEKSLLQELASKSLHSRFNQLYSFSKELCHTKEDALLYQSDEGHDMLRQLQESASHLCDVNRVEYINLMGSLTCKQALELVLAVHERCIERLSAVERNEITVNFLEKKLFHLQQTVTLLLDLFFQISPRQSGNASNLIELYD